MHLNAPQNLEFGHFTLFFGGQKINSYNVPTDPFYSIPIKSNCVLTFSLYCCSGSSCNVLAIVECLQNTYKFSKTAVTKRSNLMPNL